MISQPVIEMIAWTFGFLGLVLTLHLIQFSNLPRPPKDPPTLAE